MSEPLRRTLHRRRRGARTLRRTVGSLLCVIVMAGCASTPDPDTDTDPERVPAEGPFVSDVRWSGNEAIPSARLESLMRTRAGEWGAFSSPVPFDEFVLTEDVERLGETYRQEGYYRAEIEATVEAGPDPAERIIAIEIEEGPPMRVASRTVEVAGAADPRWPQAPGEDTALSIGSIFRLDDYRDAKDRVLQRFARAGFPDATLAGAADLDVERSEAHVRWVVTPGPFTLIGDVRIVGLETTDEAWVRSLIELERGEPLDPTRLASARDGVFAVGVFESVVVAAERAAPDAGAADPGLDQYRDVVVRVSERKPRNFEIGVGYATDEHVRGRIAWKHINVAGLATTVGAQARASFLRARIEGFVERPRYPDARTTTFGRLIGSTEDLETYEADEARLELGLRRGFPWFDATLRYSYEWARIHDVSLATERVLDEPEGTTRLSLIDLDLVRDRRDDAVEPSRGTRTRLGFGVSPAALGSDVSFLQFGGEWRGYLPLGSTVLAGRLTLGVIQPFGTSEADEVPLTERYFAGGGDSVRGYRYQHVGPLDASGDPVGGTTLVTSSLEWRFPIWREIGGVVFVDAGGVGLEPFQVDGALRVSAGAGLRYATPVGPLRLDLGVPLNRPDDASAVRVHVSIGHTF